MITLDNFNSRYYTKTTSGRTWMDRFRSSILVLPFTSNPSASAYDRNCGLMGVTGEFFRLCKETKTDVIKDFEEHAVAPIRDYLIGSKDMSESQSEQFIDIVRDILCSDGVLNVIDPDFLKYIPLRYDDSRKNKKFEDGQIKLAEYLFSMINFSDIVFQQVAKQANLFSTIIKSALEKGEIPKESLDQTYYIIPFVQQYFRDDFRWLIQKESHVIIKNIPLLLHFYACYSIMQTISFLRKNSLYEKPLSAKKCFYILATQQASGKSSAVKNGWSSLIPEDHLSKLYGTVQALDIANSLFEDGKKGLFCDVLEAFESIPFEEAKPLLETVLSQYQEDKSNLLKSREETKINLPDPIDTSIRDYKDFIEKLVLLCTSLQSKEYETKLKSRVLSLMQVQLLASRREYKVLCLNEDMLLFLIALVTREQKTRIDEMYKSFEERGILFSLDTRSAIEALLQKLNLLERKSDSGEAQYVTAIL